MGSRRSYSGSWQPYKAAEAHDVDIFTIIVYYYSHGKCPTCDALTMSDSLENLWIIYQSMNELVRFADTKASAILATETVAASVLLPQLLTMDFTQQNGFLLLLGAISALFGLFSFYYAVQTLVPANRVEVTDEGSILYFGEIVRAYPLPIDYERAVGEVIQDEEQMAGQISRHVWAVAQIANKKYRNINRSIRLFAVSAILGLAALIGALML